MTSSIAPNMNSKCVPEGDPSAVVSNVQRFSLHDGGGIRTVVFLKGCPFHCPWCCNPENLSREPEISFTERLCIQCSMRKGERVCHVAPEKCPTGAKKLLGKPMSVNDLVNVVMRDKIFYEESGGGVTVSGGECLLYQDFLYVFLERCQQNRISTALETTLALPIADTERLVASCDIFLVDYKIADRTRSLKEIGLDPKVRDFNVQSILALGARLVARMPIIPGFTDELDCVMSNVATIKAHGIDRVDILPFHQLGEGKYDALGRPYALRGMRQLNDNDVHNVLELCKNAGLKTTIHGE